jgi:hypothetical protein
VDLPVFKFVMANRVFALPDRFAAAPNSVAPANRCGRSMSYSAAVLPPLMRTRTRFHAV